MNLAEAFATWQAWNERNVLQQALRRAEADGRGEDARRLRDSLSDAADAPSAVEALAAQHELAERLGGWRWHTVTAAREQGATWRDIAAATGSESAVAQQAYRDRVSDAQRAAAELDIPFRDAERYRAAARDDTDTPAPDNPRTDEVNPAMADQDDLRVEHISGPDQFDDGVVVGEIALPGGLPPDEDDEDDDQRWEEAFEIADRDGYVVFDPSATGGFRALTADERSQLLEAAEPETGAEGQPDDAAYWNSDEGHAYVRDWAVETADPQRALEAGPRDDPAELGRRLDDLRVRLTGYTWREGVDRDEAIADRHVQLGRWYDDDHTEHDGDAEDDDGSPSGMQLECGPDVGKSS